jgi:hypothetical protein
MKKPLLLPTLLLALNLGAATTEPTITTSPKKERSLKQRHDKWVTKNPYKNMFISTACLLISNKASNGYESLEKPLPVTAALLTVLIFVKMLYDYKLSNDYYFKKLNQINQLKKEIAKLKQQQ